MRSFVALISFAFLSTSLFSQSANNRSPLDATNWGVVYDHPTVKKVKVRKEVKYSGDLGIDIYSLPELKPGVRLPAVIFLNAIGDRPDSKIKSWEIYKTWPRLVAAHGMIGISMDADAAAPVPRGRQLMACPAATFWLTDRSRAA